MENTTSGLGFAQLLTIVFIVLKVLGHIDWSWIWVFAPLWISFFLWIVIFLFVAVIGFSGVIIRELRRKARRRKNR